MVRQYECYKLSSPDDWAEYSSKPKINISAVIFDIQPYSSFPWYAAKPLEAIQPQNPYFLYFILAEKADDRKVTFPPRATVSAGFMLCSRDPTLVIRVKSG